LKIFLFTLEADHKIGRGIPDIRKGYYIKGPALGEGIVIIRLSYILAEPHLLGSKNIIQSAPGGILTFRRKRLGNPGSAEDRWEEKPRYNKKNSSVFHIFLLVWFTDLIRIRRKTGCFMEKSPFFA
jgi:hypothetical protein